MKKTISISIYVTVLIMMATVLLPLASKAGDKDNIKDQKSPVKTASGENNSGTLRMGEFGIRYMPTFSSLDFRTSDGGTVQGSAKLSHGFGVMLGANLSNHFGIQAEVNYYQVNQKYRDLSLDNKVNIRYINIPLLISLNTNKSMPVNLNVVFGPQFGINIGSDLKTSGNTGNLRAVAAVRKGDVGFAYGAGLEIALNSDHTCRLDLGYRGFYGFVNMNSSSTDDGTYNVIVKAYRKTNAAYAGLTFLF